MAQEPETEKNASGIAHAAKRKWGYDAEQVDAFLERAHMLYEGEGAQLTQHDIQNVSFELVKGGYVIAQVDAALARLERAVVDKQTTWGNLPAWPCGMEGADRGPVQEARRACRTRARPTVQAGRGQESELRPQAGRQRDRQVPDESRRRAGCRGSQ